MLSKEKHQSVMAQILKDIYSDIVLASILGFKGGTAAYMFYDLPRFSVDLDFDLLDSSEENRDLVFEKVRKIIGQYGEIRDEQKKFATIFFSLSYGAGEHQIKVEINTRKTGARYEMLSYLGIPIFVADKQSMFGGKMVALVARKKFAARDLFDVHFFFKQNWDVSQAVLNAYEISSLGEYLKKCITFVENVPDNKMLLGLGELIDEKQKAWVKVNLKNDALFLLRLALDNEMRKK